MRIDWIIAVVTFLMFAAWGFSHYSLLSTGQAYSAPLSAIAAAESVVDYMMVPSWLTPLNYTSNGSASGITLWAYVNWTGDGMNSTRVIGSRGSVSGLGCAVSGDKLYWNASVSDGDNYFFIESAPFNTTLACNASLSLGDDNQTTLWSTEKSMVFSASRNAEICSGLNSSYDGTRSAIPTTYNVNLLIESHSGSMSCGPALPRAGRRVFVIPATGRLWEGGDVNVSVRLWS